MSGRRAKATPVDRPRLVAFEVMHAVSQRQSYANLLLPKRSAPKALLVGTLPLRPSSRTAPCVGKAPMTLNRRLSRLASAVIELVRDLLRLGAHQVLSMSVPGHAAVSTTVELAKTRGARSASGLVNAVLRRMSESPLDVWLERLTAGLAPESAEALSLRHSHPAWLVTALGRALSSCGRSPTELVDLLTADNIPAPVTLVARPGRSTVHELLTGSTFLVRGPRSPSRSPPVTQARSRPYGNVAPACKTRAVSWWRSPDQSTRRVAGSTRALAGHVCWTGWEGSLVGCPGR